VDVITVVVSSVAAVPVVISKMIAHILQLLKIPH
jgi:hypothetical protein